MSSAEDRDETAALAERHRQRYVQMRRRDAWQGIIELCEETRAAAIDIEPGEDISRLQLQLFLDEAEAYLAEGLLTEALRASDAAHQLASQLPNLGLYNLSSIWVGRAFLLATAEQYKDAARLLRDVLRLCQSTGELAIFWTFMWQIQERIDNTVKLAALLGECWREFSEPE